MTDKNVFAQTEQNRVHRVARRSHYDHDTVFQVFDQAWLCHVGFSGEHGPTNIPMLHARMGDEIIFHGASKSRLMLHLSTGDPVCLSVAIVDGLVLARSLFHHSMNYRSAVAFGSGREITGEDLRLQALKAITDKIMPGRWDDARKPNGQELKATMIAAVKIESASAKIRTGGPLDDQADYDLNVWAGVVPFRQVMDEPVTDVVCRIRPPGYVDKFIRSTNS